MPHVVALMLAGAGLYAGYRWLARQAGLVAEDLKQAEAALKRRAAQGEERARDVAKDLGQLEWDETAGVYRPTNSKV